MKNKLLLIGAGIIAAGAIALSLYLNQQEPPTIRYKHAEREVYNFLTQEMMDPEGGIYSYYKEGHQEEAEYFGSGHDILSESTGLILYYSVLSDNKELFDKELEFLKKYQLDTNYDLPYWKLTKDYQPSASSCPADDLRIIKSLLLAYEKWEDEKHLDLALRIAEGEKQAVDDNLLTYATSWDSEGIYHGERVGIAFPDFKTMDALSDRDPYWDDVINDTLPIILNAQKPCGIFWQEYDIENEEYVNPVYSNGSETIHIAWTGIKLADYSYFNEANKLLQFFKKEYKDKGMISGAYDPKNCIGDNIIEDPGAYAVIAQLAIKSNDEDFAKQIIDEKLLANQNTELYGAITLDKYDASSFVNLESLITLRLFLEEFVDENGVDTTRIDKLDYFTEQSDKLEMIRRFED